MDIMQVIQDWYNTLQGIQSNYQFFLDINSGWLEMEFKHLYGDNPTEKDYWNWMLRNAETVYVSDEIYKSIKDVITNSFVENNNLH
jgi:hypothetical protein